jgi:hypothetical protein
MPLRAFAIYRPYVEDLAINWQIDVPPVAEMAARIIGLRVICRPITGRPGGSDRR